MEIKLENIGLIKDSTIRLDGLTVITGENNSGKTTVGKAIYALVEGVSDLAERAKQDQGHFVIITLEQIKDTFESFFLFPYHSEQTEIISPFSTTLNQLMLNSWGYIHRFPESFDSEQFARELYKELTAFSIDSIDFQSIYFKENWRISGKYKNEEEIKSRFQETVQKAIITLDKMFEVIERDPELIDYARGSINETFNSEFHEQIQPVLYDVEKSRIEVSDDGVMMFAFDIAGNKIVKSDAPIFFGIPYKRALFVDNPLLLDSTPATRTRQSPFMKSPVDDSYLNKSRIIRHEDKLRSLLRTPSDATVLEKLLAENKYAEINKKISEVISGNIEMSADGDFYVVKGKRLHFTNLATGSKMFSILKILIDKGQINERTLLVLDEPESHLHPEWQNKFAEVIVLLVSYLNTNVVLTSHSPNFVMAIDAYMRKHEITDKTNFYQTRRMEDGFVEYVDVNDDLGQIYTDFMDGYSEVKELRDYYLDSGDCDDD